jgi:hypothetical protein
MQCIAAAVAVAAAALAAAILPRLQGFLWRVALKSCGPCSVQSGFECLEVSVLLVMHMVPPLHATICVHGCMRCCVVFIVKARIPLNQGMWCKGVVSLYS